MTTLATDARPGLLGALALLGIGVAVALVPDPLASPRPDHPRPVIRFDALSVLPPLRGDLVPAPEDPFPDAAEWPRGMVIAPPVVGDAAAYPKGIRLVGTLEDVVSRVLEVVLPYVPA